MQETYQFHSGVEIYTDAYEESNNYRIFLLLWHHLKYKPFEGELIFYVRDRANIEYTYYPLL